MLSSYLHDHLIEAGCDEVGRGCLSGPVVAAAVILPKDYHHPLMNDSKKLRKNTRKSLENEIKNAAISWAIAEVSHQEIDRINILQASFLSMHRLIDQLRLLFWLKYIETNSWRSSLESILTTIGKTMLAIRQPSIEMV